MLFHNCRFGLKTHFPLHGAIIMGTGYQPMATLDMGIALTALFRSIRYAQRQENLNKEAVDRYLLDWIEARM